MATLTGTKKLYVLERPLWLDAAEMSKGINHDRQPLGIIMPAGQAIKIRQKHGSSEQLTLRLLNTDSQTEASVTFGAGWTTLSASADSVPFVDTPYRDEDVVVEYEYPANAKILPVYEEGASESESLFFQRWDSQHAEFALITSGFVNMLVPAADKQKLRTLHAENSLERLIEIYNNFFEFFNALAGLSFTPKKSTDRNIHNRYFIKADKNGPGAAYYGNLWTAESTSTVNDFWLFENEPGWGCLHEIAHGYQGHFMSDAFICVSEVWNNIYCACYQDATMGDRQYQAGWLYDYGRQGVIEKNIDDFIKNGTELNQWDVRSKLYFFMQMIKKGGREAFIHFNQQYRQICNLSGFVAQDYALLDRLSASFATVGEKIDVTPFMQLVGAALTPKQRAANAFCQAKAVYPLNQLVAGSQLVSLQQQLGLKSPLALVDTQQLKASGLTGSVSLRLNIDDFRQIENECLLLLEGDKIVKQVKITRQDILLEQLPIGVYTLRLPTGRSHKYALETNYLIVKAGKSSQEIGYTRKIASPLINQLFSLVGLGDAIFCTVALDHHQGKLRIDVINSTPHSYFPNITYATLVVRDSNNREIYRKTMEGNRAVVGRDEIAFSSGYQIEIYHAEPGRVRLSPSATGILDSQAKTAVFTITPAGLKNNQLNNNPETALAERLEQASLAIAAHSTILTAEYASQKDDLWLGVMALSRPLRDILYAKYYVYFSRHNELPEAPDVPEEPEVPDVPEIPDVPEPAPALYPLWQTGRTYTGGDRVTHKGKNYLAKWWIGPGNEPGLETTTGAADGDGRPWTMI